MTSRSGGRLMVRAASSARSTSCWLTSRCLPETAITPRLLTPRMCPPAIPTSTDAISTPAIPSASPTACLIDSTVESMLTTTPLRRPRHGLSPTPTMSSSPAGDHSAMTQHDLVVPTSSPAITWRVLALAIPPSLAHGFQDDLIAEAQVDDGHGFPGGLELGEHAEEPAEPRLPVLPAEPHLYAVESVEHRPLGAAHVDLGDRLQEPDVRSQQEPEHGEAGDGPVGRLPSASGQILGVEPADDRRAERHRARFRAKVDPLLVDPVQPAGVDERERAALLHDKRHAIGQAPDDGGVAHQGQRLEPRHHVLAVEREDVGAGRDVRRRLDLLAAQPVLPAHL